MVSTTPFFARLLKSLLASLLGLLLCSEAAAQHFRRAEILFAHERVGVTAFSNIVLPAPLDEALHRGLPLPFVYEFHLSHPRTRFAYRLLGNWIKPTASLRFRLSYQSLTGAYRLTSGSLTRSFATQGDALAAMGVIHDWIVVPQRTQSPSTIAGMLRFRLDQSRLPQHYQMTALGAREWQLDSGWVNLSEETSWGE